MFLYFWFCPLITLHNEIDAAVSNLLLIARDLTRNTISSNCKFILSEIVNSEDNFFRQWQVTKLKNDKKKSLNFEELMLQLSSIYTNLYDINLVIYKATIDKTIIDVQYYPKSALDEAYRQKIADNPPMLHCKVAMPPWRNDDRERFDINWQHKILIWKWKLFWARQKLKFIF